MATKLGVYNGALIEIGAEVLASLTDPNKARRTLDAVYEKAVNDCLAAGQWNFAIRSVRATADVDTPAFGWTYAFTKPTDWVRTAMLSSSETFDPTLLRYEDEAGYWAADIDTIYVKYVSNSTDWGFDLALWPSQFERYVIAYLAWLVAGSISNSTADRDRLETRIIPHAKRAALSADAMNGPVRFAPAGSWTRGRYGGAFSRRYDRA